MSEEFEIAVLETHRMDPAKEKEGVKCFMSEDPELPDGQGGTTGGSYVIVRRWQNPEFMAMMQQRTKKNLRQIEAGNMPWEKSDALMNEVVATTVMVGWGGPWFCKNGVPVPYTPKLGETIIQRVPCVKNDVEAVSKDEAMFRVDLIDETVGESSAPLSGSEDGAAAASSSNEGVTQA